MNAAEGWADNSRNCRSDARRSRAKSEKADVEYIRAGSRASFRNIGFVTKPFCLRQAVRDKPPRQASATSLCDKPFLGTAWVSYLFFKTAPNSRDKPRDTRMKQVSATYACNTGG